MAKARGFSWVYGECNALPLYSDGKRLRVRKQNRPVVPTPGFAVLDRGCGGGGRYHSLFPLRNIGSDP